MTGIFDGIKVLDLTRVIAGPLATQILGDMGATVYKIEKPHEGDDARRMGPFMADAGRADGINESAVYLAYNRGKRSVTIDIGTPEGAALARQLAAQCDVVVENYKSGGLKKYGLDYESVRALRPDVVYCSVTGFGQDGPYATRPAYDFILQGMAGVMSTCGQPDGAPGGGPMRTAIPVTDIVTGLYAAIAISGALYHRSRTGEGQYIDAAMLDASVAFNGHLAVGYLMTGRVPARAGNTNPIASPSEVLAAADGPLIVAVGNNMQFAGLCEVLGCPEAAADERFASNALRVKYRDELRACLAPRAAQWRKAELLDRLQRAGVPSGPINDLKDVFADPQTRHREMEIHLPHAGGGEIPLVRSPLRFSRTPVEHVAPPLLGEHTEQVLREELGLDAESVRALGEKGVV